MKECPPNNEIYCVGVDEVCVSCLLVSLHARGAPGNGWWWWISLAVVLVAWVILYDGWEGG